MGINKVYVWRNNFETVPEENSKDFLCNGLKSVECSFGSLKNNSPPTVVLHEQLGLSIERVPTWW